MKTIAMVLSLGTASCTVAKIAGTAMPSRYMTCEGTVSRFELVDKAGGRYQAAGLNTLKGPVVFIDEVGFVIPVRKFEKWQGTSVRIYGAIAPIDGNVAQAGKGDGRVRVGLPGWQDRTAVQRPKLFGNGPGFFVGLKPQKITDL